MFDLKAYEHALIDHEITDKEVAHMMGITAVTLNNKKTGASDFGLREIQAFKDGAQLTKEEALAIFFN